MKKLSILLILILTITNCKKEQNNSSADSKNATINAIAIFVSGEAKASGEKIKVGTKISANQEVVVGEKSTVDLQIMESESPITIRIKENSKFTLKVTEKNGVTTFQTEISSGEGFFNVSKQKSKKEGFDVVTPTSIAGVRGTKFGVTVSKEGKAKTTVLEGMVANKVRIKELEGISEETIEKNPNLKKLVNQIDESEVVLSEGQKVEVSSKDKENIASELGITETLKLENPSDLAKELNNQLEGKELKKVAALPKVEEITQEESNSISEEISEVAPLEQAKLKDNLDEAFKERDKEVEKKKKEIFEKNATIIKLKNGKSIRGIIKFGNAKETVIITENGEETFKPSEIDTVE